MSWIAIQPSDVVQKRLTAPEISAIQTKVLAPGQTDPIPEEIESVSNQVRGYVGNCVRNLPLAPKPLIPEKLKDAATALVVYNLCQRLPTSILLTPDRIRGYEDALTLLRAAAKCEFAIERPVVEDTQEIIGALHGSIHSTRCRNFGHGHEDGI